MVFQVSRPDPVKIPLPLSLTIKKVSVQFSCSVMSNSLRPHELHHARPPCPSPTPRVYPNPRRFRGYLRHTPSPMDLVTHFRVKTKISVTYKPVQWVWWLINSCEVPHNGNRIVALYYGEDFSMGGSPGWSEYQQPLRNFFNYKKGGGRSFLVLSTATLSKVSQVEKYSPTFW